MDITTQKFYELLEGDQPVLVDYWAPWCGYCRRIAAAYGKIAEQYEGQIAVVKVNVDQEPRLAMAERIEVIPTLVLYKDGKSIGTIVAPESKAAIEAFIEEKLG